MAGCSGSPGRGGGSSREGGGGLGLDASACGSAVQACIAKGDATPACVNDQAIASLSGTKETKNDAQLLQGCERTGGSPSECLKAIKDCSAKGAGGDTSSCVDKTAREQAQLMAGCSGSPKGGASGKAGSGGLGLDAGACQKAVDTCIAKGDATSSCVDDQAMGIAVAENTTGGTNGSTGSGQTDPTGQTAPTDQTGPAAGWDVTTNKKE